MSRPPAPADVLSPPGDTPRGVAAIVLAAGAGQRFAAAGGTGPKLLAEVADRPVLAHAVESAMHAGLRPIVVVLPPSAADLHAILGGRPGVTVVVNRRPHDGLATSVVVGLDALAVGTGGADTERVEACVVLLGDQPFVDQGVLSRAIAAWRRTDRPVRVHYADGPGHPVLLPRVVWGPVRDQMARTDFAARGSGAGPLLAGFDVLELHVDGPAPVDVDVPADLARVVPIGITPGTDGTVGVE
jgi:molybdenum cofactor cytidylyltransferase